eukprot:2334352-Pleurochrysis_carterae.AAC.1
MPVKAGSNICPQKVSSAISVPAPRHQPVRCDRCAAHPPGRTRRCPLPCLTRCGSQVAIDLAFAAAHLPRRHPLFDVSSPLD